MPEKPLTVPIGNGNSWMNEPSAKLCTWSTLWKQRHETSSYNLKKSPIFFSAESNLEYSNQFGIGSIFKEYQAQIK